MDIIKRHTFLIICILVVLGVYLFLRSDFVAAPTSSTDLSDSELITYAQSDFDKSKMMNQEIVIGTYNGAALKASFPCSDVCPDATIRVIYLDVAADQCEASGGELRSILVPMAITVMPKEFCFPKPIVESGIYEFLSPTS